MAPKDSQSPEERLRELLNRIPSAEDIAAALDAVGRQSPSRRRRWQSEVLARATGDFADLAERLGWDGKAIVADGRARLDQDGVILHAEPRHFRTKGGSAAEALIPIFQRFRIRPKTIVDLNPGSGEIVLHLARRFPSCRVIAVDSSPESLEALDANLLLQDPPIGNLQIAPLGIDRDGRANGMDLIQLSQELCLRRIDLLRFDAEAAGSGLAAWIQTLGGNLASACVTFAATDPAGPRSELLAAFEAAGLVLLEKRSTPAGDAAGWLQARLAERAALTVWFVQRRRLNLRPWPATDLMNSLGGLVREPARRRAWLYGKLDELQRLIDPTKKRFEFEKLYAVRPDPWFYLTNPYETLKYRRTLDACLRHRPGAGAALEIACSIGVFTRILARTFDHVTAVDVAGEALRRARRHVGRIGRVRYVRGDIRSLRVLGAFDVIFCAEMLYYLSTRHVPAVLQTLKLHLATGGIVVTVFPQTLGLGPMDPAPFWRERLLDGGFRLISEEDFDEPPRPYVIQVYALN